MVWPIDSWPSILSRHFGNIMAKTYAGRRMVLRTYVACVLFIGIVMLCLSCTSSENIALTRVQASISVNSVQEKIPVGTQRVDAIRLLDDAECHIECWSTDTSVEDLFFYGACDLDNSRVAIVTSRSISNTMTVMRVGTFENYLIEVVYDDCLGDKLSGQDQ
jgi:hypothetical protein